MTAAPVDAPPYALQTDWGTLPDGSSVERITLRCGPLAAEVLTLGAALHALWVPDRDGLVADVILAPRDLPAILARRGYWGTVVGRVANRIAGGRFPFDGREVQLPLNDGPNTLHGGPAGFDLANWRIERVDPGEAAVTLRHDSPDGEGGPGRLTARAAYRLTRDTLLLELTATCDAPTVVNLSSHAYWNLAGEGAAAGALGQTLAIPADAFLPTDATAIPTGEFRAVVGTPFDFRQPVPVGARVREDDAQLAVGRGYDHNWMVARAPVATPRLVARLADPASGRVLELHSNQPGVQMYSGNFLDGTAVGKGGRRYRQGDGVVLEPQAFPDTPNRPEFGSIRLAPGETYRNVIAMRFPQAAV